MAGELLTCVGPKLKREKTQEYFPSTTDGGSSPEGDSQKELPLSLRSWNRSDILNLKITPHFCPLKLPLDFVNMLDPTRRPSRELLSLRERACAISEVLKKRCLGFAFVLDEDIYSLSSDTTCELLSSSIWSVKKVLHVHSEQDWGFRFETYGQDFGQWLDDIVRQHKQDSDGETSEYMFQFLFDNFTRMFGFKSRFSPCIPTKSINIMNNTVSGCPDLLYKRISSNIDSNSDCNIIGVCEVKKHFNLKEDPSPRKLRKTMACNVPTDNPCSSKEDCADRLSPHISDSLLGQHVGELLLYYPYSIKEHMILGMIIQQTNVTFTALCLSADQFTQLKNGTLNLDRKNGPQFLYSKPYNYLLKKDRDLLLEPLVLLGLMQSESV